MPEKRKGLSSDQMAQAIASARQWMPMEADVPIEAMTPYQVAQAQGGGLRGNPMGGGAGDMVFQGQYDRTSGNVGYNAPEFANYGYSPEDMTGLLVHELTHARQKRRRDQEAKANPPSAMERLIAWWRGPQAEPQFPYGQDPDELEAYQAASDRATALGLPPIARPSFDGGPSRHGDIALPPPARRMGDLYGR